MEKGPTVGWDDAAWDGLVSDLYLSAVDHQAAARLPGRLAALTGGLVASMWRLRARDNAIVGDVATTLPAEAIGAYRDHYYQHDPWGAAVRQAGNESVVRGAEVVSDATLTRSTYYNEFGVEHGMFHLIGALVPLGSGKAQTVGVVSILQPRETKGFDEAAVAALGRALPHIREAFRLRTQLDETAAVLRMEALDAALEGLGIPAAVLDGHGVILKINALAEGLSCIQHALVRRDHGHGVLRSGTALAHKRLAGMVAAAARGEAGGMFRLVDQERLYVATVSPLPERLAALTGSLRGRVLLLLRPQRARDRAAEAAALFGLTGAEKETAAALSEGLSPAEIAEARGVKVSTVRTLLRRAQDKAECRNLRDLVGVLASLG